MSQHIEITGLEHNVPLAPLTTIGLGGAARFFLRAESLEQLRDALRLADQEKIPLHILGGGSNTLFADEGFPGLVVQVGLRGVDFQEKDGYTYVTVGSGEEWDAFVLRCIEEGLAGLECLSGVPGSVGATPVQNVGAYGQEVAETVTSVTALERESMALVEIPGAECAFGYRRSRFKGCDRGRYVLTAVTYRLQREGRPCIRYAELCRHVEENVDLAALPLGRPALEAVRRSVLALRKRKSMVVDPADPNSRSAGSFFLNPILSTAARQRLQERWQELGGTDPIPLFDTNEGTKISAAWLIERAGFCRGYRRGGAAVSANHTLALVNLGTTTRELLELAAEIQAGVEKKFGVRLEMEPEVVGGGDRATR